MSSSIAVDEPSFTVRLLIVVLSKLAGVDSVPSTMTPLSLCPMTFTPSLSVTFSV